MRAYVDEHEAAWGEAARRSDDRRNRLATLYGSDDATTVGVVASRPIKTSRHAVRRTRGSGGGYDGQAGESAVRTRRSVLYCSMCVLGAFARAAVPVTVGSTRKQQSGADGQQTVGTAVA